VNEDQFIGRISTLENRQRLTILLAALAIIILAVALVFQWSQIRELKNPQELRVRELAVVDEHGTERVLIAAPVPYAIVNGKRVKRDGAFSGIIISDATGAERGGYGTGDGYANALLTLDSQGPQTVMLLAEPDGSTMFRIWNGDKGSITMGAFDYPFLNVKQNGKPLFVAPPDNPKTRDSGLFFR
jgi:hypothetical protein